MILGRLKRLIYGSIIKALCNLIPLRTIQTDDTKDLFESNSPLLIYAEQLPGDLRDLEAEFKRWKAMRSVENSNPPKDAISSLKICDSLQTFPNIKVLLQIYVTLPVTAASSERSFS